MDTIQHTRVKRKTKPYFDPYPLAINLEETQKQFQSSANSMCISVNPNHTKNLSHSIIIHERKMQAPYETKTQQQNTSLRKKFEEIRKELNRDFPNEQQQQVIPNKQLKKKTRRKTVRSFL